MAATIRLASKVSIQVSALASALNDDQEALQGVDAQKVIAAARTFIQVLDDELDLPGPEGERSSLAQGDSEKLKKHVAYIKRSRAQLAEKLKEVKAHRTSNLIKGIWFVRVGMGNPIIPARTLA